jgi:hypothetical protein
MKVEFGATQMLEYISRNYISALNKDILVVGSN